MNKNNKGMGLISIMVFIFSVGVVGIYGFQIALGFLDHQTIKGAVKEVLMEAKNNENTSVGTIKANIQKRMYTSDVDLNRNDISVKKDGEYFDVYIEHMKEIKVTERISIVMNLDVEERTE